MARYDASLGVYEPIVYLSDFWVLMRDLVLVNPESIERIEKVRAGEKIDTDNTDLPEKEIEKRNWNGQLKLTWDNYSVTYASYQEQFKLS